MIGNLGIGIRDIGRELDLEAYQVRYALDQLGIKPARFIGRAAVYPPSVISAVRRQRTEQARARRTRMTVSIPPPATVPTNLKEVIT